MSKNIAFVLIIGLRLFYQPSQARPQNTPFASPSTPAFAAVQSGKAKLLSFKGSLSEKKVILEWIVGENETADQFRVEKSQDGKTFVLAALVFGTDQPAIASYRFYEIVGKTRTRYRVKLISKNKKIEYSGIIEINPPV